MPPLGLAVLPLAAVPLAPCGPTLSMHQLGPLTSPTWHLSLQAASAPWPGSLPAEGCPYAPGHLPRVPSSESSPGRRVLLLPP